MKKHRISETVAKAGIYLLFSLSLFALLFMIRNARGYQAASPPAPSAGAGVNAQTTTGTYNGAASSKLDSSTPATAPQFLAGAAVATPYGGDELMEYVELPTFEELFPPQDADIALKEYIFEPNADGDIPEMDAFLAEVARMQEMGFTLPDGLELEFLGNFHATAYCCEVYPHICGGNGVTASGTVPTPGRTVASDWSVLPPGTWIYIRDVGIRRVEDSGSAIKQQRLDIAVDTHENALRWRGFGRHDVWVLAWAQQQHRDRK